MIPILSVEIGRIRDIAHTLHPSDLVQEMNRLIVVARCLERDLDTANRAMEERFQDGWEREHAIAGALNVVRFQPRRPSVAGRVAL